MAQARLAEFELLPRCTRLERRLPETEIFASAFRISLAACGAIGLPLMLEAQLVHNKSPRRNPGSALRQMTQKCVEFAHFPGGIAGQGARPRCQSARSWAFRRIVLRWPPACICSGE